MSSYAAKVAVTVSLVLVVAIALQYLASYAVTGTGASFLLRPRPADTSPNRLPRLRTLAVP